MPLKCPKCSRINADNANICIYCRTSLENAEYFEPSEDVSRLADHFLSKGKEKAPKPASDQAPKKEKSGKPAPEGKPHLRVIPGGKSLEAGRPARDRANRFWVVLAPMESISRETYKLLGDRLKMDPYYVRQRVMTGNPWVMRKLEEAEQAHKLAKELLRMGLDVYSLSDKEIIEVPERMPAQKVTLEDDGLIFERGKDKIKLRWNDVVLIVRGRIRRELTDDSLGKRKKRQLKKPGLRPMGSDTWEYEVCEIYPCTGRGVRLSERDSNFTGLGKHRSLSSLRNLHWIIRQFESRSAVTVNDGYKRTLKEFKPVGAKSDYVARRLGRLQEEQMNMHYIDNSGHFDEYSVLTYLHFKKLEG